MIRKFNSIICRFFAPHSQDNTFSLLHGPIPTYYSLIFFKKLIFAFLSETTGPRAAIIRSQIFFVSFRVHSIILVIESLLFGLFVIAIGCDQLSSIFDDTTAVEFVKKEGSKRNKSNWALLQEVFGKGSYILYAFYICRIKSHFYYRVLLYY